MEITDQATHTILAALRCWQARLEGREPLIEDLLDVASNGGMCEPLNVQQIEELCHAINFGDLFLA